MKRKTKNLGFRFAVHWLVLGAMVTIGALKRWLPLLKKHGVKILEIPWEPLMQVKADVLVDLLRAFGINEVALCAFFGDIDPLSKSGRKKALASLERAAIFASELESFGIVVYGITGPWAYQIAKQYSRKGICKRLVSFGKEVAKIGRTYGVTFHLECLRWEENKAMEGSLEALEVVKAINDVQYVKLHLDTFHMDLWGENITVVLEECGPWLGWFHGSGQKRYSPGRPGKDHIDYEVVREGLARNRANGGGLVIITFEGFSPEFRVLVPAIGGEFPKDLTPGWAIARAKQTFKRAEIIALAR